MLLPVFIFSAITVLYENLYPQRGFTDKTIWNLFVFFVYLIVPVFLFSYRYEKIFIILTALPTIAWMVDPWINKQKEKQPLLKDIYYIFWKSWGKKVMSINELHFRNDSKSKSKREKEYTHCEALRIFQESFVNDSVEIKHIVKHLKETEFITPEKSLTVLDIGGFNGEFTAKLLGKLGMHIEQIVVVEPIEEVEHEYKNNLSSFTSDITFNCGKFEDYHQNTDIKYDLILASHSLYSSIDNSEDDYYDTALTRLLSFLDKNGLLLLIMGSKSSNAYSLKADLLKMFFPEKIEDSNSEEIGKRLDKRGDIHSAFISVDNCINLNDFIEDEEKLKKWVSYFARVPEITDSFMLEMVKDIFMNHSIKYEQLPECSKELYNRYVNNDNVDLLLHKTKVFLISNNVNIVKKRTK
jgi:hypothetical protein